MQSKSTKIRNPKSEIRNGNGFTLIEVLLAMAILAVIMSVIYGSFSTAGRNVEQAEAARDETDLARTLLSKLTDDLANAYYNPNMNPVNPNTNANVNLTILYGKKAEAGEGEDKVRHDSLSLTTLTNFFLLRPDSKETELLEVGYFFKEKPDGSGYSLYRREKRELSADVPPLEGGVEYEITDRVEGLQFRYYNGTTWVDEWDTRTLRVLPKAVELALTLDTGKVYVTQADVSRQ
jgi:general secretion pathway protein J